MFSLPRKKAFWLQTIIGLGLAIGCVLPLWAVQQSLERQGITTGFDFLTRSTGWDIGFSLVPYSISDPYWWVIVTGLINTLFLGIISLVFATLIGIIIGTLRISTNPVLAFLGTCYVETIRNVPLILQVFFWYAIFLHLPPARQAINVFGILVMSVRGIFVPTLNVDGTSMLFATGFIVAGVIIAIVVALLPRPTLTTRQIYPKLISGSIIVAFVLAAIALYIGRIPGEAFVQTAELKGLNFQGGIKLSPELATLITSISLFGGAFMGEIVRAGFLSVGRGQVEAAQALGLTNLQVMTKIRLPLALRMMLPTMTNQFVWLLKATTLGIVVGFSDLFSVISTSINHSGQTIVLLGILMASFLIMNNVLATFMNFINRRIAIRGNQLRV